jgi:hypothetical protein
MSMPTPKTLDEAIKNALLIGPLDQAISRTHFAIRDFLAQRFGVAYFNVDNPQELERLQTLFESIVRTK